MPERPSIPAEIQRQILIESGHRCAVCGAGCPLERAHIIPWHRSKEHKAEDLICLCASCHERADQERWGEKALREYKQRPWIMRNYEKLISSLEPTTEVELTINMELSQFDDQQQRWLQYALAAFLDISPHDIRVVSVKKSNSVTVTIELPAKSVEKLLYAYNNEDPELLLYLHHLNIMKVAAQIPPPKNVQSRTSKIRSAGSFKEIPELLLTLLKSFSLTFHVQGASDLNQLKSINVPWGDREVVIYVFRRENGIEVYTRELELVGKSLVIVGNEELRCEFFEDDTTEGMKASGFMEIDDADKIGLDSDLKAGIAD